MEHVTPMNTFELNKIAGAVLGTVLLVMGLGIVADGLYATHTPAVPGYAVDLGEVEPADGATKTIEKPEINLAALLSEGDAEKGIKVAKKCAACHTFDDGGANKVGPNLYGVVGRQMAAVDGFGYSDALKALAAEGGVWSYEALNGFLAAPKKYLKGTNMAFAGIKKDNQRADLVIYLKEKSPAAPDLPKEEMKAEAATETPAEAPMAESSDAAMPAADAATKPAMEAPAMEAPATETPAEATTPPAAN